jgi:hypothetical protein
MRGSNIKNIYVFDQNEFQKEELSQEQRDYINSVRDLKKYNDLRNEIIFKYGEDVKCLIKIIFPSQLMEAYDELNQLIESR